MTICKNNNKGFSLMATVAICTLLMICSSAMFTNMLQNRIALRKEIEKAQIAAAKDVVTRDVGGLLGKVAIDDAATAFNESTITKFFSNPENSAEDSAEVMSHFKSGMGRAGGGDVVKVTAVEPDDIKTVITDPTEADILTATKPYEELKFPNIRFGILKAGTPFVGRAFAYRLNFSSNETDNTDRSGSLVGKDGATILRVIEMPMQLGTEGENFTIKTDDSTSIYGNLLGKSINLLFKPAGDVSAMQDILETSGKSNYNRILAGVDSGVRGQTYTGSGRNELDAGGGVWFIPVGKRVDAMYDGLTVMPGKLTRYAHPYYQTDIRITANIGSTRVVQKGSDPAHPESETDITVKMGDKPINDNLVGPLRVFPAKHYGDIEGTHFCLTLGRTSYAHVGVAVVQRWNRSATDPNETYPYVTEVDIPALIARAKELPQSLDLKSVYIQSDWPVVLREGKMLTKKFSLVTNQTVYIPTSFGTDGESVGGGFSIIARKLIYGRPGYSVGSVTYVGQRVVTSQEKNPDEMPYPAKAMDGTNAEITGSGRKNYLMAPIQRVEDLPPVFLKSWLIYLDSEIDNATPEEGGS